MIEVTQILSRIAEGDPLATDELLPLVYHELRNMARAKLIQENPGQTLQATALVHEAYLRLLGPGKTLSWESRAHFFAAAAESMRRILVDSARRKQSLKRSAGGERVPLESNSGCFAPNTATDDLLALDDALGQLQEMDPLKAQVVKLRYFAGLTVEQTAEALDISPATVKRHWVYARCWLYRRLQHE